MDPAHSLSSCLPAIIGRGAMRLEAVLLASAMGLAVTDHEKRRVADEVVAFAPRVDFKVPNAVCFSRDGFLYTVEQNRVLKFPAGEFFYVNPDVAVAEVVPQGQLIPPGEESFNHTG